MFVYISLYDAHFNISMQKQIINEFIQYAFLNDYTKTYKYDEHKQQQQKQ